MSLDDSETKHKGQLSRPLTNKDVLEKVFKQSISSSDISQRESFKDLSKIARELEAKRAARKDDSSSDEQAEGSKKKKTASQESVRQFMYKDMTILPSVEACRPTAAQLEKMSSSDFRDPMKSRKMRWNVKDEPTCQGIDSDTSTPNVPRSKSEMKEIENLMNKIKLPFSKENSHDVAPAVVGGKVKPPELVSVSDDEGCNRLKIIISDVLGNSDSIPKNTNFKADNFGLKVKERCLVLDRGRSPLDGIVFHRDSQLEGVRNLPNKLSSLFQSVAKMHPAQAPINSSAHLILPSLSPSVPLIMPNIHTIAQVGQSTCTPFSQTEKCQEKLLADIISMIDGKCPFPPVYMYTTPCQSPDCKYEFPILPPRRVDKAAQPACVERKFISISKLHCNCRDGCFMQIVNFLEEVFSCNNTT